MQCVLQGGRVLRRVLRRGSKKGLSRRHLEGRNTPFREYDPVGVRQPQPLNKHLDQPNLCGLKLHKVFLIRGWMLVAQCMKFILHLCPEEGSHEKRGFLDVLARSVASKSVCYLLWLGGFL